MARQPGLCAIDRDSLKCASAPRSTVRDACIRPKLTKRILAKDTSPFLPAIEQNRLHFTNKKTSLGMSQLEIKTPTTAFEKAQFESSVNRWVWLYKQLANRYGKQGRDTLFGQDSYFDLFHSKAKTMSSYPSVPSHQYTKSASRLFNNVSANKDHNMSYITDPPQLFWHVQSWETIN